MHKLKILMRSQLRKKKTKAKRKTKHEIPQKEIKRTRKDLSSLRKKVPYCVEPGPDQLVLWRTLSRSSIRHGNEIRVKTCPKGLSFSSVRKRKAPRTRTRSGRSPKPTGRATNVCLARFSLSLSNLANHAYTGEQIFGPPLTELLRKLLLSITGNCWRPPPLLVYCKYH